MSNYLIDIEDAVIAKVNAAKRPGDPAQNFFNRVDVFRGEKSEVFLGIARETAPSAWLRLDRMLNKPEEFRQVSPLGQASTVGTLRDEVMCVWSIFLCARSLRSTKELSHGGPGVIGAYDMINLIVGPQGSPPATLGQVRGFVPISTAEPFIFVGLELLGQTTTETVYESQFRTRVQLT